MEMAKLNFSKFDTEPPCAHNAKLSGKIQLG
jgi:hypothetical protein